PDKLPTARGLAPELLVDLEVAYDVARKGKHLITLSPFVYFGDETPPEDVLRLWCYATRYGAENLPAGLELRTEGADDAPAKAWFNARNPEKTTQLRSFAGDGDGGIYALWLVGERTLSTAPVVFLGGEGEVAVVTDSMRDFLTLLGTGQDRVGSWAADGM